MSAVAVEHRPRPSFLVCPPDFFDAHFLFNPFMGYRDRVHRRRARVQWSRLVSVLEQAGADVRVMEPQPVTGALSFTADGALVLSGERAVVLRNDGPRGALEPPVFANWLRRLGYAAEQLPPRYRLDGGNLLCLPGGDVLAGLKPGASGRAERYLGKLLGLFGRRLWTVPLAGEPFLHIDTAIGVLRSGTFLVHEDALADGLAGPLVDAEIVAVARADAERFACNIVVIGDVVVTGPVSDTLARRIGRLGFEVVRLDLSEFYKAGGGAKCLTLPLTHD